MICINSHFSRSPLRIRALNPPLYKLQCRSTPTNALHKFYLYTHKEYSHTKKIPETKTLYKVDSKVDRQCGWFESTHNLRALARSTDLRRDRDLGRHRWPCAVVVVPSISLPRRHFAAVASPSTSSSARPRRAPHAALYQRRRDLRRRRRSVLECIALVAILDGGADRLLQRVRRQPLPANELLGGEWGNVCK